MENSCVIGAFTGYYEFLANDYNCTFEYDGITFNNVETAWLSSKCVDKKMQRKFARLSASAARKKRNTIPDNDEWDMSKDEIMYDILRCKFTQNESLKKALLKTKGIKLINNVTYRDTHYGIYMQSGKNILGKLLMKLREELESE